MPDHVHLLIGMHASVAPAELMQVLKARTTGWMHKTIKGTGELAWQEGYGAFNVSYSGLDRVRSYIANQERHHREMMFQEEFIGLLERHRIEYDIRYIWD
jgi:putative transposase